MPLPEREEFTLQSLIEYALSAKKKNIEPLVGIVDEEGDVTFYSLDLVSPEGNCTKPRESPSLHVGKFIHNRVLLPKNRETSYLNNDLFFGKDTVTFIHLSLIEAQYLQERSHLQLGNSTFEEFKKQAEIAQPDLSIRYPTYRFLRDRGMRVKTGFKYGTHFRAYSGSQHDTHADFLIHVIPEGAGIDWQEISRGIRVAHGVKKKLLLTNPDIDTSGQFLQLTWVRP